MAKPSRPCHAPANVAIGRRELLVFGAGALGAGLALGAMPARAAACFDPDLAQDEPTRGAVNFLPVSTDPARHCGRCAFFKATGGGCGTCVILSGGAVSNQSVCDSFVQADNQR